MTVVRVPADPSPHTADSVGAAGIAVGSEMGTTGLAGLPRGVLELAATRWREAEAAAIAAGLRPPTHDDDGLQRRLEAELTAPLRIGDWPDPNPPRAVAGGWVNDEVIDEDRPAFDALIDARPDLGPDGLADLAQELRWPVTPYRRLDPGITVLTDRAPGSTTPGSPSATPTHDTDHGSRRPIVLDLSTHWAGPLSTALLAEAGAEVLKIDPDCRPDGFRERQELYRHLNGAKTVIDLDLRRHEDRDRFESLAADADLLVESFSRRVLPNLGYDRARLAELNPAMALVSIKAFPASSREADWLAYGPGVHAHSGLGWPAGQDRPEPPPIAYPDLLAGVTAYGKAAEALTGAGSCEVSLAGSIAPLVQLALETSGRPDG